MELAFKLLDDRAVLPERAHEGDAGLDLRALDSGSIPAGERLRVGTGLAVAVPDGHAGLVVPRSGLASRHGVTVANAPGLIDSGYRGELQVLLLNASPDETFEFKSGDRIAQLVVVPVALPTPAESPDLDETSRGGGGFGSSGHD